VAVDGIISERDIVHALAQHGSGLLALTVAEVMTRPAVTCDPSESLGVLPTDALTTRACSTKGDRSGSNTSKAFRRAGS